MLFPASSSPYLPRHVASTRVLKGRPEESSPSTSTEQAQEKTRITHITMAMDPHKNTDLLYHPIHIFLCHGNPVTYTISNIMDGLQLYQILYQTTVEHSKVYFLSLKLHALGFLYTKNSKKKKKYLPEGRTLGKVLGEVD